MSQRELLQTQLDTAHQEVQQLQVENRSLQEGTPEGAALVDTQREADKLRAQSQSLAREMENL